MSTKKKEAIPIDLSSTVKDERLPVPTHITDPNTGEILHTITLHFNPANLFIYKHMLALRNVPDNFGAWENVDDDDELEKALLKAESDLDKLLSYITYHLDGIFGKGATVQVFEYSGYKRTLINDLVDRVERGISWFEEYAEADTKLAHAEAKKQALMNAKAQAKQGIANMS